MPRIVVMLLVIITVIGGIHTYLWWRLVANTAGRTAGGRRWRRAGALVLAGLIACALLAFRTPATFPDWLAVAIAEVGYLWIAVMFYLLVILLVLEFVRPIGRLALRRSAPNAVPAPAAAADSVSSEGAVPAPAVAGSVPADGDDPATAGGSATSSVAVAVADGEPPDPGWAVDRRVFLSRALAVTAGVAAVGTVGFGMSEARNVRLKRASMTLAKLDPRLDGFRFAVLTDIHLSETLRRPFLDHVVRRVNALEVDAVAVVGDLVDGSVDELGDAASALRNLRSTHGSYFVTGNHEYYSGAEEWVEFLPSIGVRVLRNERVELAGSGAVLDLAGVDDVTAADSGVAGHGANLSEALAGRDTDRPVVLLAHQPVQWPDAVKRGVDLQLSGHTHGGQMWPFTLAVPLQQPVVAGTARDGDSQIYVSRGVGTWGPPVRVGAPPEISLITLRAPD